jgi:uncharacterized membrane protein YeaQ/YmgE (transglycosylase-associated protein family)
MSNIGWILSLVIAAICSAISVYDIDNRIPGGFFTAVIIGMLGGWIAFQQFGAFGPSFAGLSLMPTIIGSAIAVLALSVLSRTFANPTWA